MPKKIGEDIRKIAKEKEIKFKPVNFDKLNKKLNKKPIRWFWKRWWWQDFWYSYTWNGIIGPGGRSRAHFRTARLSLIISILAFILMLIIFIKVIF